jgi:ABC-type nickel/cobalt efflux system permease component RcnA
VRLCLAVFWERAAGLLMLLGGVVMLAGVVLRLAESHGHEHTHEPMTHAHPHAPDVHHQHVHRTS